MTNEIPIASMLIEATDGGSLQKLATAVAAFANKPQQIKVGVDYSDFDPSKLPSLTARLGVNLQAEMRRQMNFTGADKKALVDSLGNPTQVFGEYMSKAMAAMPAMMITGMKEAMAPVGRVMAAEIFSSLQKESSKQAGIVAKNMALILKSGSPLQQASGQASIISGAAAVSGANPAATSAANQRIIEKLIKAQHEVFVKQGMSQRMALDAAQYSAVSFMNQRPDMGFDNPQAVAAKAAAPINSKIVGGNIATIRSQQAAAVKVRRDHAKALDAEDDRAIEARHKAVLDIQKKEHELAQLEEKFAAEQKKYDQRVADAKGKADWQAAKNQSDYNKQRRETDYKRYRQELDGEHEGMKAMEALRAERDRRKKKTEQDSRKVQSKTESASDRLDKGGSLRSKFGLAMRNADEDFNTLVEAAETPEQLRKAETQWRTRQNKILKGFVNQTEKELRAGGMSPLVSAMNAIKAGTSFADDYSVPHISRRGAFSDVIARQDKAGEKNDEEAKKALEQRRKSDEDEAKNKAKQQRDRLAALTPTSLKKRFFDETKGRNLYDQPALEAAGELQIILDKEIEEAVRNEPGNRQKKVREQLKANQQRASAPYLDPILAMDPESRQANAARFSESITGGVTGQRIGSNELLAAADDAAEARKARAKYITQEIAKSPNNPQNANLKTELTQIKADLGQIENAKKRILELDKQELEILKRIDAGYGGMLGGVKQKLDSSALKQIQNERKGMLNPKKSSLDSAHNMNFAMMNAAYGFQDFFQVLAQPGMGPGRAVLAAANNVGPALGVLAGNAVGANVAVGGLLAGMSLMNMMAEKETQKFEKLKEAVDDLTGSYTALTGFTSKLSRTGFGVGSSTGAEGLLSEQKGISDNPFMAEQLRNRISQASVVIERIRTMELSRSDRTGPLAYQNLKLNAERFGYGPVRGLMAGFRDQKEAVPMTDVDRLLPEIQKRKSKDISETLVKFRVNPLNAVMDSVFDLFNEGEEERKYDKATESVRERREQLIASGEAGKSASNKAKLERDIEALDEISKTANSFVETSKKGLSGAVNIEKSLGVSGISRSFVANTQSQMQAFAEQEMSARMRLDVTKREQSENVSLQANRGQLDRLNKMDIPVDQAASANRKAEIEYLKMLIEPFDLEMKKATKEVEAFSKSAAAARQAFKEMSKVEGFGRIAASQMVPGFDQGGILASQLRGEDTRRGLDEFKKNLPGMADQGFLEMRSSILQFGQDFAAQFVKIQDLMTDFESFKVTNVGAGAAGRLGNFASSTAMQAGKDLGFDLGGIGEEMFSVSLRAQSLRERLNELAGAVPGSADAIGRMKDRLDADLLGKGQQQIANDPLMKALSSVDRFAIEVINLSDAMKEGALRAKASGGAFTEQQGKMLKLDEALVKLGFTMTLGRQISDFDNMVKKLLEDMKAGGADQGRVDRVKEQAEQRRFEMLAGAANAGGFQFTPGVQAFADNQKTSNLIAQLRAAGVPEEQIGFIQQQQTQKRFDAFANSPNEQARRSNAGGFVDDMAYGKGGSKTSGRYLNFQARIASMQEQLQRDLMAPGLDDAGKENLRSAHKKSVAREISGFVGGSNSGQTKVIDSASLWQRIQESLTNNPAMQVEESQLEVLRQILESLRNGGQGGSVFQKMLEPANIEDGIVPEEMGIGVNGEAGPLDAVAAAEVLKKQQEEARARGEKEGTDVFKRAQGEVLRQQNRGLVDEDKAAREDRKKNRDNGRLHQNNWPDNTFETLGQFDARKEKEREDYIKSGVERNTPIREMQGTLKIFDENTEQERQIFSTPGYQQFNGPQNLDGAEQAMRGGISSGDNSLRQIAVLEKIEGWMQKLCSDTTSGSNSVVSAIENSTIKVG